MERSYWLTGTAIGLVALALLTQSTEATIPRTFPNIILWVWESKQDLRFIQPGTVGLAFLERTVWLHPHRVRSLPRSQPFTYTPGTPLIATVRMELSHSIELPLPQEAASAVAEAAKTPGLSALQIDFDARLSHRNWYAEFLHCLRRQVPQSLPITITALESWCEEGRPWLDRLPVAEATPMLFRMGVDESRTSLRFSKTLCNSSVGVSTDEMPQRIPRDARRIYIFHPGPWTEADYHAAMYRVRTWRTAQ